MQTFDSSSTQLCDGHLRSARLLRGHGYPLAVALSRNELHTHCSENGHQNVGPFVS